jgi:hypothetical protein
MMLICHSAAYSSLLPFCHLMVLSMIRKEAGLWNTGFAPETQLGNHPFGHPSLGNPRAWCINSRVIESLS